VIESLLSVGAVALLLLVGLVVYVVSSALESKRGWTMPTRPLGPCCVRGCPGRAVQRGRCEEHAKEYRRQYEQGRPSAAARGYDSKWRVVRAAYLKAHPICSEEGCGAQAEDVDHIVALKDGGTHAWANLRAYCHSHHSQKTNRVDGGGWKRQG
jgi:5-methylcytosine-specific restriction protein A